MWSSVGAVALSAIATVVLADLALQRFQPLPPPQTDVADGERELSRAGPDILVFGSSHSRSFRPLKEELARRAGHERVAIFTMESGWAVSFEWAFRHRVAPLLDQRPAISRVIIPITLTDVCGDNDHTNIPRNGWRAGDFFADVAAHGMNDYNRSYLPPLVHRLLPFSLLAQRGLNVVDALKASVRPAATTAALAIDVGRGRLKQAFRRCPAPEETAALERLFDDLTARGLDVTAIMFPLPPVTVDKKAIVGWYREVAADVTRRHGVRLLDWAQRSPLGDDDFMADLDHANAAGNAKLAAWALAGDLAFLLEPAPRHAGLP